MEAAGNNVVKMVDMDVVVMVVGARWRSIDGGHRKNMIKMVEEGR